MFQYFNSFDGNMLLFIQEHLRNPILTPAFQFITTLGNGGLIWLIIISFLLVFKKSRKTGLVALITLVMCIIINNVMLKHIIARPRPFDTLTQLQVLIKKPTDFSFPSGHTASSFAVAGAFYYYGNKKWGIIAFLFAGLIGFSRLYLGVHYPSDVICGALSGLIISLFISRVAVYLQNRSNAILTD